MKSKFQKLALNQLEEKVKPFKPLISSPPPKGGWLKAIRSALGMTASQLAQRLEIKQPSLVELEQSEVSGTISFKKIRKAAEAMDCVFVYAIVPRTSLADTLDKKAQSVAEKLFASVSQSMALENQALNKSKRTMQFKVFKEDLKQKPSKTLWR